MNTYILDQMEDLGYSSHNSIVNLGSLGLFSFIYVFKVILYICLLIPLVVLTKNKKLLKSAKKIKKNLFGVKTKALKLFAIFENN